MLRAALDPAMVSVIPNAVITDNFQPRGGPYKPLSSADQSIPSPTLDIPFFGLRLTGELLLWLYHGCIIIRVSTY